MHHPACRDMQAEYSFWNVSVLLHNHSRDEFSPSWSVLWWLLSSLPGQRKLCIALLSFFTSLFHNLIFTVESCVHEWTCRHRLLAYCRVIIVHVSWWVTRNAELHLRAYGNGVFMKSVVLQRVQSDWSLQCKMPPKYTKACDQVVYVLCLWRTNKLILADISLTNFLNSQTSMSVLASEIHDW